MGESWAEGHEPPPEPTPLWTLKATQLLGAAASASFELYTPVYYTSIELSRKRIGVLQFIAPFASFGGQLFWAAVADRLGEYKRTLVWTQVLGTLVVFCCMLQVVQETFVLMCLVTVLWCFLLSTSGPLVDAMCLTVLVEQTATHEAYGDQRLWCAIGWGGMALIAGQLIDVFGIKFIFIGFAVIQSANIAVCTIWLPQPRGRAASSSPGSSQSRPAKADEDAGGRLCTCEVVWFFANLLQYGIAMSLIESFLFVFLLQDFHGTSQLLLGASTAVMCTFEVPVFKYIALLWQGRNWSLTSVLLACQLILALRCWLYTLLLPELPWLVLLVEPLHGICFAAMWAVSVEYAQRLAPPGATARMQALVSGIYYQVAIGLGSIFWGAVVENPPKGMGFQRSFILNASFVLAWCVLWQAGLLTLARKRARRVRVCAETQLSHCRPAHVSRPEPNPS